MTPIKAKIYFEDECPRIGSGWRTVLIKTGRKWAYLIDPYTGNRSRIKKELLKQLNPAEIK